MASAAEHAHCNATAESALILPEEKAMMSHAKIVDPRETKKSTQILPGVKVTALQKVGPNEPLFTSVYVDDFIMASVQVDSFDRTALVASTSLASDHMRPFGSGENDEVPILAPKKSTDWNSIVDALGFTINTHTMRISITNERVDAIRDTLEQDWPRSKQ